VETYEVTEPNFVRDESLLSDPPLRENSVTGKGKISLELFEQEGDGDSRVSSFVKHIKSPLALAYQASKAIDNDPANLLIRIRSYAKAKRTFACVTTDQKMKNENQENLRLRSVIAITLFDTACIATMDACALPTK
jgi:hypothetical protein